MDCQEGHLRITVESLGNRGRCPSTQYARARLHPVQLFHPLFSIFGGPRARHCKVLKQPHPSSLSLTSPQLVPTVLSHPYVRAATVQDRGPMPF